MGAVKSKDPVECSTNVRDPSTPFRPHLLAHGPATICPVRRRLGPRRNSAQDDHAFIRKLILAIALLGDPAAAAIFEPADFLVKPRGDEDEAEPARDAEDRRLRLR